MAEKIKILTISDHPLVSSGVGTQQKYLIEGLLETGRYKFVSLGGAMKHPDYRPMKLQKWEDDWVIYPVDGYANEHIVRQILDIERPQGFQIFTDPRFFSYIFNMSDEIRDRGIPLFYWTIWDAKPTPKFNKNAYASIDFLGCISKLTHSIVCELGFEENSAWIPHAVDNDIFTQFDEKTIKEKRAEILGPHKNKFIIFYNSRNARRKMTSDVLRLTKDFLNKHGQDKAHLFMKTSPFDKEGANLIEVKKMLGLTDDQISFHPDNFPPEKLAEFYNIADVTICISNAEGFGCSSLESLSCGTSVVSCKTGGLQDQPVDDEGNMFGALIEPAIRSLVGSQDIPYIYEDRCLDADVIAGLEKVYFMSREERAALGKKARKWVLKTFSMDRMINSWDEAFTKYTELYKNGNPNRIRFKKI